MGLDTPGYVRRLSSSVCSRLEFQAFAGLIAPLHRMHKQTERPDTLALQLATHQAIMFHKQAVTIAWRK